MLRILLGGVAAGALVVGLSNAGSTSYADPGSHAGGCDRVRLGTALLADTLKMSKTERSSASSEAVEGVQVEEWEQGSSTRVIKTTYFGDTGRTTYTFYLLDRMNFVFLGEELVYATPLGLEPTPKIRSRVPTVLYFCAGRPDLEVDTLLGATLPSYLDSLLMNGGSR